MSPPEASYPNTASPEYSRTTDMQENNLSSNFMEIIEESQMKMNKSLKESEENPSKKVARSQ